MFAKQLSIGLSKPSIMRTENIMAQIKSLLSNRMGCSEADIRKEERQVDAQRAQESQLGAYALKQAND
jgi:hypothetical protein